MKKVAIVTGAGSGIGFETAKALYESGWTVYDLSRTDRAGAGIRHIGCDVSNEEAVFTAVDQVIKTEGRIDLIVNNAGYGISGAIEYTRAEDSVRQLYVNLFGQDNLVRACMAHMRKQGRGRIVNMSSAAAIFPIPFQAWYSVSKAAVNAYTLALRNEVKPFGVSVCAVMPGDIKTGFTSARQKRHEGDEIYGGRIERAVSVMEKDEMSGISSASAGKRVAKICEKKHLKPLYVIGFKYKLLAILNGILPKCAVNCIIGKLYGG